MCWGVKGSVGVKKCWERCGEMMRVWENEVWVR